MTPPRGRPADPKTCFEAVKGLHSSKKPIPPWTVDTVATEATMSKFCSCDDKPAVSPFESAAALSSINVIIPTVKHPELNRYSMGTPDMELAPMPLVPAERADEEPEIVIPSVRHGCDESQSVFMPSRVAKETAKVPTAPQPAYETKVGKRDMRYASILAQAQKLAEYALNELQFRNVASARQFVVQAIAQLSFLSE